MIETLENLVNLSCDKDQIQDAISSQGPLTIQFASYISDICEKLSQLLGGTEESVSKVSENSNLDNWKLELASFLRELQCPYDRLMIGESSQRLQEYSDRHLLLEFLLDEILVAKKVNQMSENGSTSTNSNLTSLFGILNSLKLSQPPSNTPVGALFNKFIERINGMPANLKSFLISDPLFTALSLNASQWNQLNEIAQRLEAEYALRRTMLITRLNATLQSFAWSDRAKVMPKHIAEAISMNRFNQSKFSHITVADALAARKDLLKLKKVSSSAPETRNAKNSLTKVKVGRVPDRGGRPSEMAAPPPEMPSWQQRSGQSHASTNYNKNQRGGGGGGGGGGSRYSGGSSGGSHGGGQGGRGEGHGGDGGGYQGDGKNKNKNRGVQGAGWKK